jgi:hypothetical protein
MQVNYEYRLESTDLARPNQVLLEQILARQNDLTAFLKEEEPAVDDSKITPEAAFPTGLEFFVISVAVAFGTGLATGIAKGAGGEIGKAIGQEAGQRIGARIRLWIQREFPDVTVKQIPEK